MPEDIKIPTAHCPSCGLKHDTCRLMTGAEVKPGGFLLCNRCGVVLVLDEGLGVRLPMQEDLQRLTANPVIVMHMAFHQQQILRRRASRN